MDWNVAIEVVGVTEATKAVKETESSVDCTRTRTILVLRTRTVLLLRTKTIQNMISYLVLQYLLIAKLT